MERAHERVGTGERRREVGECSQRLGPSCRIAFGSGGWGSCFRQTSAAFLRVIQAYSLHPCVEWPFSCLTHCVEVCVWPLRVQREVSGSAGVTLRLTELVELGLRAIRTIYARKDLRRAPIDIWLKSAFSCFN